MRDAEQRRLAEFRRMVASGPVVRLLAPALWVRYGPRGAVWSRGDRRCSDAACGEIRCEPCGMRLES